MKKILVTLLLISAHTHYGQDCKTQAANKPSVTVRFPDAIMESGAGPKVTMSVAKLKPQLSVPENWIKGILKNFTGAKLAYSNEFYFDLSSGSLAGQFYIQTGIKGYCSSKMRFYAYYCYDNNNKVFTEDESGSFVDVYFNNVFSGPLSSEIGVYTINGKYAFKLLEKKRTEGRIDYYELPEAPDAAAHDYIIIRNSDQPVFIKFTRKEYLEQMMKDLEDYKKKEIALAKVDYNPKNEAINKEQFDAELKRIDNSKNYTPEQMAPYRKRFIETWETEKQKFDKRVAKIETNTKGGREVLLEYMKKPQEWLSRSFPYFYPFSTYDASGIKNYLDNLDVIRDDRDTPTQVVSLNPAYYNKSLSADIPQLIMVHASKGTYAHMKKVSRLIKAPGALTPLENILSQRKQTVAATPPAKVTAAYSVSYLPKLNELSPLTVPADMKSSMVPSPVINNPPARVKLNIDIPSLSPKLKQLPAQTFTPETYKKYALELSVKIAAAIKPDVRKKADDYINGKNLSQTKDISNTALAAWLQNSPEASLYLYSKAVVGNTFDILTANNLAAFLIMAGLPEKSIPILEFLNKKKPGEAILLSNLGNAYFRLGDINNAMKYLQQCVQKDSLHPVANKLLCIMYLKKGDTKKAEEHGTRSISSCHDEQVIAALRQLNNKIKPGEVMSRFPALPAKEFPLLKRIKLPAMPTSVDDMEQFAIELNAIKESLKITIADIENKKPGIPDDVQQKLLMSSFANGISSLRMKAQHIIMDGMQIYNDEKIKEFDVFRYKLKALNSPHNAKAKAIQKKYADQLNKLEGGEAGDEDKIAALEIARCKELNEARQAYLAELSPLVNQYAQRQECVARKFFRDYANWAAYWMPESTISFPSIEKDYLKDVVAILGEYQIIAKSNCSPPEPLPAKDGVLQKWEDEYCANAKGNIGIGPAKMTWTCNSWSVEGGEGIVGGFEMKFADDGAFEDFTLEIGLGETLSFGNENIAKIEAGTSVKEFIKIGPDKVTGKWDVKDMGIKTELSAGAGIAGISKEVKLVEVSVAVNAGVSKGGALLPLIPLD